MKFGGSTSNHGLGFANGNQKDLPVVSLINGISNLSGATYTGGAFNVPDYTGTLQTSSANVRAIRGGRLVSASEWSDELADGTLLQPVIYETSTEGRVKSYVFHPLRQDSTAYSVGDKVSIAATDVTELWMEAKSITGDATTAGTPPSVASTDIGSEVTDNNVTWTVKGYHTIKGREGWPVRTNKCTCRKYNPTDTTNLVKGGDASATMGVVSDATALASAGLDAVCTTGNVYVLDNSGGSTAAYVDVVGATGNTNNHTVAVYARAATGTGGLKMDNRVDLKAISGAEYKFYSVENIGSVGVLDELRVFADAGAVIYFILPQLEEGAFATPPIIDLITDGLTTVTRTATVDSHPTAGVLPVNDWGMVFKVVPGATGQSGTIWESKTDASNLVRVYTDADNVYFDKTVAATTTTVSVAYTHAKGTEFEANIYQATSGMGIRLKEVGSAFSAWDEDATANGKANAVIAATQQIGCDGDSANHFSAEYPSTLIAQTGDPKSYLELLGR